MPTTPPPEFSTPEFLARLQHRDREAVRQVVHEYLPQILRAARGAGLDEHEADDVTQLTFLTFIETLPRFEGRSQVRTWLFGILYHKLREARRVVWTELRRIWTDSSPRSAAPGEVHRHD